MINSLLVGIPTLNEADNISSLVQIIDQGLSMLPCSISIKKIVNADNQSQDRTSPIFANTPSKHPLIPLTTDTIGKGRNIHKLFNFALQEQADAMILLDGDVKSIKPNWIKRYFIELNKGFDFVVPNYQRKVSEGNTTNHLVYPSMYAYFGAKTPSQPIAGDFGCSIHFINDVMECEWGETDFLYGIDVFLTINCLQGNFNLSTVQLDQKIHNPSFDKMYDMFVQVSVSMLKRLADLPMRDVAYAGDMKDDWAKPIPSNEDNRSRIRKLRKLIDRAFSELPPGNDTMTPLEKDHGIDTNDWASLLSKVLLQARLGDPFQHSLQLRPWFLARVLKWYYDFPAQTSETSREEIQQQATLTAQKFASMRSV